MVTRKLPARKRGSVRAPRQTLGDDIRGLIADALTHVATNANPTLQRLSWRVGRRIRSHALSGERAAYGEEIVVTVSRH